MFRPCKPCCSCMGWSICSSWSGSSLLVALLGLGVFLVLIHFWIPSWCCKGHISFEFFRRPLVCIVGRPLEVFASHFLHLLYSSFWWTVCYQGSCYVEGYFLHLRPRDTWPRRLRRWIKNWKSPKVLSSILSAVAVTKQWQWQNNVSDSVDRSSSSSSDSIKQ